MAGVYVNLQFQTFTSYDFDNKSIFVCDMLSFGDYCSF